MPLDILIVDDESLARQRLSTLLGDCPESLVGQVDEADDAPRAIALMQRHAFDLMLLDIQMPGMDGLALAGVLRMLPVPPCVVFVTAHAEHALAAFEVDALDYLTKPVRLERLQQALQKAERQRNIPPPAEPPVVEENDENTLVIQDRGRIERVPVTEVLYLKAELKYVTVRTVDRSYILDGALQELEERHAPQFLRVHRNALVSRSAIRSLERCYDALEGEGWAVRLHGVPDLLGVSRRQVAVVREALVK